MSENVHPRADELDDLTTVDFLRVMHEEDLQAVRATAAALEQMARAVDEVTNRLRAGGRLHYFGAGTSGLIAALDAVECPATFGVERDLVQAHVATEPEQEDDPNLGRLAAAEARLGEHDVAVGVSASGKTAFVLGAFERAVSDRALLIAICCNPGSPLSTAADIAIEVATGPEVIAGSTRLKAGTIQKLLLNMLSTTVFTRLGHTHRGRMVGVVAANDKLRERAAHVVADLTGISLEDARRRLRETHGDIKAVLAAVRTP